MKKTNFKKWLHAAAIRAIKTVAQSAVSIIGVGTIMSVTEIDWLYVCGVALTAGILSMLTSIAGLPEVPEEEGDEEC